MILARWRHRARRLLRLPPAERRDLVRAQWYLIVARARRRWTPLGQYVDLTPATAAPAIPATGSIAPETGALSARLALAVERAAEHGPVSTTCLERAVALDRLLRHHGVTAGRIRVGVRWQDAEFLAHAWVELGDKVLADSVTRVRGFQSIADAKAALT